MLSIDILLSFLQNLQLTLFTREFQSVNETMRMMMVMMTYVAIIYVASDDDDDDDDDGDISSTREALSIVTKKPLDSLKFSIRKRQ